MEARNEQVKKDIVNQLYWDQMVDASDVMVTASDGTVVLTGTVPSFAARRAAYTDSIMIPGVHLVDNQIQVRPPALLPTFTDDEVKMRVEKILEWNADIDATNITVSIIAGRITLKGHVDAYWKKMKITELVYDIMGVTGVNNAVSVVPTEGRLDTLIADDIMATLERSTDIDISNIEVTVENGMVTLSGTVPDWNSLKDAETIARYTGGVVDVDNDLSPRAL